MRHRKFESISLQRRVTQNSIIVTHGCPVLNTVFGGSSRGQYAMSGENTMVHGPQAAGGSTERSYDPRKRPRSAVRR